jgi:hypothetical protein
MAYKEVTAWYSREVERDAEFLAIADRPQDNSTAYHLYIPSFTTKATISEN